MKNLTTKLISLVAATGLISTGFAAEKASSVFDEFVAPATNPVWFESALHSTEIRPIYMYQDIHSKVDTNLGTLALDGKAQLYAVQLRYQVSDTLSIIATKDGYARIDFNDTLDDEEGFANLGAGIKWSPVLDEDSATAVTIGARLEIQSGAKTIYQDQAGSGNIFLAAAKGYGDLHIQFYEGVRSPFSADSTTWNDMSFQLDYKVGDFYPLVGVNWHHVLKSGSGDDHTMHLKSGAKAPFDAVCPSHAGVDLLEFGASDTQGNNYVNLAIGCRWKASDAIELGLAWEDQLSNNDEGLFDERVTFDMIYKF